ncbi:tyrosine-type recombinase/integrase [Bacillus sp. BML-BC060]|uniref:tyrosine-type recombinase/integrase n=1 Tax=Bacillus sp. BML-BC060 TaxID=2842487 RepID=UPI001C813C37|nr:tyrosine-type recombinase/integrase [Bacillus sp. BML-BC060]
MQITQPIKDLAVVEKIGNYLKKTNTRDYMLYRCMLFFALRTQDILSLQVKDVRGKYQVYFKEQKSGKTKIIEIHPDLVPELEEYTKNMEDEDWLFPSQKKGQAISRQQAFRRLQDAGRKCGLETLSGHTLRKTFCYHSYLNGTPISILCELLNHSSESVTRRYIGLKQEDIRKAYFSVKF